MVGVLGSGGGKWICYEVGGLMLGGRRIVMRALICLMKEEVDELKGMGIHGA